MPNDQWITDMGGPGFAHIYHVDRVLHDGQSPYQRVRVIVNSDFGRMLILDEAVQTTERDEFIYHELLAHVPLCAHPAPKRALIIGGGDGGLLREALRHPGIEHVTMVELDREVVDVTRRLIPSIPRGAFDDPRAHLLIEDGMTFARQTNESFDVAMVDSTDPKGPSLGLFSTEFYGDMARLLGPSGALAVQSGSPLYQQDVISMVRRNMSPHFKYVRLYMGAVPTYPGVLWTFTVGAQHRDPATLEAAVIEHRLGDLPTQYYTPRAHAHLFDLPPFLRHALGLESHAVWGSDGAAGL